MQTYIVSFASFLAIGIVMRLIHSGSSDLSLNPLIAAGFLLAAAVISLIYRSRVLAFLLLCAAICVVMLALPADPALNLPLMGVFVALFLISIVLGFLKLKALPVWILSALVLGYGLTRLHLDTTSPYHLIHWAGDDRDTQSVVYGIIVKEPEVRPEDNDTRLTIEPSLVVKIDKHPGGRQTLEAIVGELNALDREWESEAEALLALVKVRDRLARDPEADRGELIVKAFARGDYTPTAEDVERIGMALEEVGPPDPEEGWIGRITRGWLLCVVLDADENREEVYPAVSQYQAYGNTVKITAPVETPPTAQNPGGFDYRAYLISVNTFATTRIRGRENWTTKETDTIEIIREANGNPAIYACMSIKYDLLEIIRQTTPFPESGFLSGIFIGLRQGVPEKIVKDSQAAGTAHVFAVSGLHVTIIAGLLLLIFNQTPIPKSIWAPIAVLFLVVFTIITGGRPSTLRAATMNSFVLIFFTYFGKNIQKSLVMAICFAAIVIICFLPPGYGGPLILPSASFLMSFSAVLFLGLLSGPAEDFFNYKLNNLHSLVAATAVVVWIGLLFMNLGNPWGIFRARLFWGFLIAIPVAFLIQQVMPFKPAFRKIPGRWLRTFIAAQAAIQCSIIPLSMVIFHRMSLAAPFANFIGIPLIGVILPLGMIGTLMGFIPVIGIQIAILITAANWLGMHFFILMDDFFARVFPYPQMPKPTAGPLVAFYLIVAFFIYREKIILNLKIAFVRVKNSLSDSSCRLRAIAALAALLITVGAFTTGFISSGTPEMKVIIFSLGWKDGMAALVQAPNGKNILIDGGSEEWDFYRDRYSYLNQGQRTVEEVLLGERVISFEAVISSNPDPRVLGGLNYIVGSNDYYVKRLYTSLLPSAFGPPDLSLDRFSIALSPGHRGKAEYWYGILLLNLIDPVEAMNFMEYYRRVPEGKIAEAINQLPPGSSPRYDPRVITEKAIETLEKKEAAAHEELIQSIISTRE
ncbi:MAG: ComEC/Rec2 family competence protein, partial [Candidatus Erginobacter occultus]|nr:ComEC/Rec2 family competence protein [Candidatus Erginobacter occultus]